MRFFLWLSVILISANTLYVQAGIFKISARDGNMGKQVDTVNEAKKKLSEFFSELQIYEKKNSYSAPAEKVIDASIIDTQSFQTGCRLAAYKMYPKANFEGERNHELSVYPVECVLEGRKCKWHWLNRERYEECKDDGIMRFIVRELRQEKGVYNIYFESSCVVQVMIRNKPGLHYILLEWLKIATEEALRSPKTTNIPL